MAKKVEAFRLAQIAADPKALGALCADEVSYSHSNGKVEDKATFVTNATDGKSKFLSIEYKRPDHQGRRPRRDRALPLDGRTGDGGRWEESVDQPSHSDELAEAGRRLEAAVARRDEVVMLFTYPLPLWERGHRRPSAAVLRTPMLALGYGSSGETGEALRETISHG